MSESDSPDREQGAAAAAPPKAGARASVPWQRTPDATEGDGSARPILAERALRRFHLAVRPRVRAGVGIVLVNARGQVRSFPSDQRPTVGELMWAGSGSLYEIDMGLHHTAIALQLPAAEDAFSFPVVAHLEWQVIDPARVVRDDVRDIVAVMKPLLYQRLADVTRGVSVTRPAEAEIAARHALQAVDLTWRYGIRAGVVLAFRTDRAGVTHASDLREEVHRRDVELLTQERRRLEESHERELLEARVAMYRTFINHGEIDQFALQLARQPGDVESVVKIMRDERDEKRKQVTDFVLQMLNSGAVERWEIDEQVRAALNWLKESTENIIAGHGPSDRPVTAGDAGQPGVAAGPLPGGAELPSAGSAGADTSRAVPPTTGLDS